LPDSTSEHKSQKRFNCGIKHINGIRHYVARVRIGPIKASYKIVCLAKTVNSLG